MTHVGDTAYLANEPGGQERALIVDEQDVATASAGGFHEEYVIYSLRWPTGIVTRHRDSEVVIEEPATRILESHSARLLDDGDEPDDGAEET